jgi:hypothetical protein
MKATTFLITAGAVSAGVHAGLAPEHVHEWLPLGISFIAAAVALGATVAALSLRPSSRWLVRLLGALFAAVVSAYAVTRLAAVPPLDPAREPFDALGVGTSALEAAGLLVAVHLGTTGGTT